MNILISGASGLIGSALVESLEADDHTTYALTRSPKGDREIGWDIDAGKLDLSGLPPLDAVVHLAGENVADSRWSEDKKGRIRESRILGTRLLCERLAGLDPNPPVLVSASGINYYPSSPSQVYDESGPLGGGFLSAVCREWEAAADPARGAGIRVVHPRIGLVLSSQGGALGKLLPVFRLGLGGPIGNGRQRMSWIALDDLVGIIRFAIENPDVDGPVNAVAPEPATNREFTRALARAVRRPAFVPVPAFAIRKMFGEMGEETVLGDVAAVPGKLREAGYAFRQPELEKALAQIVKL